MAKNKSTKTQPVPERSVATPRQFVTPDQTWKNSPSKFFLLCLLLFTLVLGVFWSATRNDFLYWYGDDTLYVTETRGCKVG